MGKLFFTPSLISVASKKLRFKCLSLLIFLADIGIKGILKLWLKSNSTKLINCPKLFGKASKLVPLSNAYNFQQKVERYTATPI